MLEQFSHRLIGLVVLATWAPGAATAGERSLSISTPVVAAAPGTTAVPQVEISYVGGDLDDAFQLIIAPTPGQWSWVGTPAAVPGVFTSNCAVLADGSLAILSFGATVGAHVGPTPLCRASVAVESGADLGLSALPTAPPTLLECVDFFGQTVPCAFNAGTLLVGARTGTAAIAYQPPPASTIALGTATTSIAVSYLPGGAGDGMLVSGCRLTGDLVVRPPRTSPGYLGFAGTSPVSGSIALACTGGLPSGNATLICDEQLNNGAPQARSWFLTCPETRLPPTVDYSVPPGTAVLAEGGDFAGDPASATLGVSIRTDGLGFGMPASSAVSNCTAPAPFVVALTPSTIQGEGAAGATGTLAIECITGTQLVERELSCSERRGTASVTPTWPLRCPARPSPVVFADGFEASVPN